jgi:hypothetical protein
MCTAQRAARITSDPIGFEWLGYGSFVVVQSNEFHKIGDWIDANMEGNVLSVDCHRDQ